MPGEVNMGGGFGPAFRAQMSDSLQRRLALDDAREQREAAQESRRVEQAAEEWRERAFAAAAQEAVANGASVLDAAAGRGLGNTPQQFIAKVNAQQDFEDALAAADQQRAYRRWQLSQSANTTADTTAPTQVELETATRAKEHAARQKVEERRKAKERLERGEAMFDIAQGVVRMNAEPRDEDRQYRQRFGLRVRSSRGFGFRRL